MNNKPNVSFDKNIKIIGVATFFVVVAFVAFMAMPVLNNFLANQRPTYPSSVDKNSFLGCKKVAEKCTDSSCQFFDLCHEVSDLKDCLVYDCQDKYEIKIIDNKGREINKSVSKTDLENIENIVSACQGFIELIEKKECIGNKTTATVKIKTEGYCEISGFGGIFDGKNKIASAEKNGDIFTVKFDFSADKCELLSEIYAISDGGVMLKEKIPEVINSNNSAQTNQ